MTNKEILSHYTSLVPFLAQVYGPGCEIVLHEINHSKNSVIAIENSITGRSVGSPLTDLAKTIKNNKDYVSKNFIVNYNGTSKGKKFLSSTYFIKNEDNLIGLLCINKDISHTDNVIRSLNTLLQQNNLLLPQDEPVQETLENPIEQIVNSLIDETIEQTNISPSRMSMYEKAALVKKLNTQGVLKMKGAMDEVSQKLNVSKPTIYRYLNLKDENS